MPLDFLIDRFVITNRLRIGLKRWTQSLSGNRKRALSNDYARIGWTNPKFDAGNNYQPLGVDGGVDLRCRQRRVTEQFLDGAQVAAAREQMRRK